MKKDRYTQLKDELLLRLGEPEGPALMAPMDREYRTLCEAYADRPQSLQKHLHNNIFPVVAAFRSLMAQGMEREKAAELSQAAFLKLMEAPANAIRSALKVPGLHRLMPWVFKTMMPKLFREDSGFRFSFYPTDRHRARFDMQACPYLQMCRELHCEDIAPVFCATDDTCYGHMHPNLIWNRTKTMARGGDICDFDLYLKK